MCNSAAIVEKTPVIEKDTLFPSQRALLNAGYPSEENWIICSPTGSGKTLMAEWAIDDALKKGLSAIYIAPLRAIVEEKVAEWTESKPSWKIGLFTGEKARKGKQNRPKDQTVLLMTPEKLSNYLLSWKNHLQWISRVGVVVIDEFHLMGDANRGAAVESMIGRLQRVNPLVRVAGFSGTLSNAQELAAWLRGRLFISNWRPVPITRKVIRFKNPNHKLELLINELEACRSSGGKSLVFVNSRKRSEQLAKQLRAEGFAAVFHHAGLPRDERELNQSRMRAGDIEVLLSTSALEMGVNFPARKVVIFDAYCFDGELFTPMSVQRFQQCGGRAGRAGFDDRGEVSLFLPVWDSGRIDYLNAEPEPVRSGMFGRDILLREILGEISGRLSITGPHLEKNFAARTLWRRQGGAHELGIQLGHLKDGGLVKETQKEHRTYLNETALGRIASQMAISPGTISVWCSFHKALEWWEEYDVLLVACLAREATPVLGFKFEEIDAMTDLVLQTNSSILDADYASLRKALPGLSEKAWLGAIKRAILLTEHTQGRSLEELATTYDCYTADLQSLKQNVGWVLSAAQRVFQILGRQRAEAHANEREETPEETESHETRICRRLCLMIEYGVSAESVGIVQVQGIGAKRAQALLIHGIHTLDQLMQTSPEMFGSICGMRAVSAEKLLTKARGLWEEQQLEDPFALDEGIEKMKLPRPGTKMETLWKWPLRIDPYRLRRALELEVTHRSDECVHVCGGTEPHRVRIATDSLRHRNYTCDCADFNKGTHMCKHIIRTRLELHDDTEILEALRLLQEKTNQPLRYTLGELWMKAGQLFDRFDGRQVDYTGHRFLKRAHEQKR